MTNEKKIELTAKELEALQFVLKDCVAYYCNIVEKQMGDLYGIELYHAYKKIRDADASVMNAAIFQQGARPSSAKEVA